MAKQNKTGERRKPRTIEEQIADLQAKAAAKNERERSRNEKELAQVEEQLVKVSARLRTLTDRQTELRHRLGLDSPVTGEDGES